MMPTTVKGWIVAGECFALVVLIACAYAFGHHNASVSADRDKATAVDAQHVADMAEFARQSEQTQANAKASQAQAVADAKAHAQTEIQYRTITQTVTKYVATHPDVSSCTLDADGLSVWRAANAGRVEPSGSGEH